MLSMLLRPHSPCQSRRIPRAGTADAVRQYMWLFEESVADGVEDYLILSGDHLYRCNYQDFVREHREKGADITVAALPCDPQRASAFGLMKIDDTGKITSFAEKPTGDALKAMEVDTSILGLDKEKAKVRPHSTRCHQHEASQSDDSKALADRVLHNNHNRVDCARQ